MPFKSLSVREDLKMKVSRAGRRVTILHPGDSWGLSAGGFCAFSDPQMGVSFFANLSVPTGEATFETIMNYDAFSKKHPLTNFLFFVGALGCGMVIQHPAYLLAGILSGAVYYLLLHGAKGWRLLLGVIPLFLFVTAINPLLNTYGRTVLFSVFDRPYTLEALLYGAAIAGVFVSVLIWFGCYNAVLTSDKFTSLFGNLIPALSLLLVMVLRLIPSFLRKAKQIMGARESIGKGAGAETTNKEKLNAGMQVLSALADWALEGGIVTGDSMRARGYGTARRSSFQIYRMTAGDAALLGLILGLLAVVITFAAGGATQATFTPELSIAPLSGKNFFSFLAYCIFLFIPTALHIKEAIQWRISRSKI